MLLADWWCCGVLCCVWSRTRTLIQAVPTPAPQSTATQAVPMHLLNILISFVLHYMFILELLYIYIHFDLVVWYTRKKYKKKEEKGKKLKFIREDKKIYIINLRRSKKDDEEEENVKREKITGFLYRFHSCGESSSSSSSATATAAASLLYSTIYPKSEWMIKFNIISEGITATQQQ